MSIDKEYVFETLKPLIPRMTVWINNAVNDYCSKLSDTDKLRKGKIVRASWIHAEIISQMRDDPAVVGIFKPLEREQLSFIDVDCERPLCVLFKKADRWRGLIRTANHPTERQLLRRDGALLIEGAVSTPIVCHYLFRWPTDPLRPAIESIALGEEGRSEFIWRQTIWTDEDGLSGDIGEIQPNLPMLPKPGVRVRKSDQASQGA